MNNNIVRNIHMLIILRVFIYSNQIKIHLGVYKMLVLVTQLVVHYVLFSDAYNTVGVFIIVFHFIN